MHQPLAIESDSGRDAEIARERNRIFERRQLVNNTLEPARDEHLPIGTERNSGRIRDVARVLRNVAADIDPKQCYRQLLASRSGTRDKERAIIRVKSRVRYWMKISGEVLRDGHKPGLTQVALAAEPDFNPAALCFRNDCQHPARAKRDNLRRRLSNRDRTKRRLTGIKALAVDHDLTPGNPVGRIYIGNFRGTAHKSRSSYCQRRLSTKRPESAKPLTATCYNPPPERILPLAAF